MSDNESIIVSIAGREYPLKVDAAERAQVEQAEALIHEKVELLQTNYGVKDKQDLLAMSLLQLMVERGNSGGEGEGVYEKLVELETFVSGFLSKNK